MDKMFQEVLEGILLTEATLKDMPSDQTVQVSMYDTTNTPRTKITLAALHQYMLFVKNYKTIIKDFVNEMEGFVGGDQRDGKPQTKQDIIKNWYLIKISLSNKMVGLEFDSKTKMGDHTMLVDVENGKLNPNSLTE
jgi:hypothetical protein